MLFYQVFGIVLYLENFLECWLRMFVGRVVSDARSAFGGGRRILDAALVTNEIVIEISL